MSLRAELGIPVRGITPTQVVDLADTAERRGWPAVWLSEVLDIDALCLAAAIAATTASIRVGTAIVPVSTRSAATLAMAASTIARLAPGRFSLGLGVSTPVLVEDAHDRAVAKPVELSRGVIDVVRRALAGEVVDHDPDPHVRGLRIVPPSDPPSVLLAALGPAMTRLATEEADGLILNLLPAEAAASRAAQAPSHRPDFTTHLIIRTIVDPTAAEERSLRKEITSYLRVPAYATAARAAGLDFGELAGPLEGAAEQLPDDVFHHLTCVGSSAECLRRLDELSAAGVVPIVVPAGGAEALVRTFDSLRPEPSLSRRP